jgi:hypothetical protein
MAGMERAKPNEKKDDRWRKLSKPQYPQLADAAGLLLLIPDDNVNN